MTNVLLLGCGGNAGMNYVRCLKKGDPAINVIGTDTSLLAAQASNVDEYVLDHGEGFNKLHFLNNLVKEYGIDFIHAQPDREARFLFRYQDHFPVTSGSDFVWDKYANKLECQKTWMKNGIGCETETLWNSKPKWDRLLNGNRRVWIRAIRGAGSKSALPVQTYEQAFNWATYWVEFHGMTYTDFMVSEYLPGPEYAVQMFYIDGYLVQAQARERVEYFFANIMPSGQSSTPSVARTVNDESVYDAARRAITSIETKPHGIYGVDIKTRSNGELVPTEVNYGRYYTTSNFFAELGINTPYDELQLFLGRKIMQKVNTIPQNYYWMRGLDKLPVIRNPDGTIQKTT